MIDHPRHLRLCPLLVALAVAAPLVVRPRTASAHETDQFTLPADDDFADLGPEVTGWYYDALAKGVTLANHRIAEAISRHGTAGEITQLESAAAAVTAVDESCLRGNDIVDAVERELASPALQRRHPGRRIRFREVGHNIYENAFSIFDLRILSRFWFGSTVKLFGHLVGTDKFGHFTAIGVSYYWRYERALNAGATEADAVREAVRFGTVGKWSEAGLMGTTTTGDYANADLAANYAGFLFFRNLAEPTFVAGTVRPPLLVRDGPYWRLAPHVRPDSDWLRPFVSDHWNEALNPGFFDESMRPALRDAARDRAARVLRQYAPADLRTDTALRDYFRNRRLELSTYWGTDYGHRGDEQSLVAIDNTCFDPPG